MPIDFATKDSPSPDVSVKEGRDPSLDRQSGLGAKKCAGCTGGCKNCIFSKLAEESATSDDPNVVAALEELQEQSESGALEHGFEVGEFEFVTDSKEMQTKSNGVDLDGGEAVSEANSIKSDSPEPLYKSPLSDLLPHSYTPSVTPQNQASQNSNSFPQTALKAEAIQENRTKVEAVQEAVRATPSNKAEAEPVTRQESPIREESIKPVENLKVEPRSEGPLQSQPSLVPSQERIRETREIEAVVLQKKVETVCANENTSSPVEKNVAREVVHSQEKPLAKPISESRIESVAASSPQSEIKRVLREEAAQQNLQLAAAERSLVRSAEIASIKAEQMAKSVVAAPHSVPPDNAISRVATPRAQEAVPPAKRNEGTIRHAPHSRPEQVSPRTTAVRRIVQNAPGARAVQRKGGLISNEIRLDRRRETANQEAPLSKEALAKRREIVRVSTQKAAEVKLARKLPGESLKSTTSNISVREAAKNTSRILTRTLQLRSNDRVGPLQDRREQSPTTSLQQRLAMVRERLARVINREATRSPERTLVTPKERAEVVRRTLAVKQGNLTQTTKEKEVAQARAEKRTQKLRTTEQPERSKGKETIQHREAKLRANTTARVSPSHLIVQRISELSRSILFEIAKIQDLALKARLTKELLFRFGEESRLDSAERVSSLSDLRRLVKALARGSASDPRVQRLLQKLSSADAGAGSQGPVIEQSPTASKSGGKAAVVSSATKVVSKVSPKSVLDIFQAKVDDSKPAKAAQD